MLAIDFKFQVNFKKWWGSRLCSNFLLSQPLWRYIYGIQLAKVRLLIDRTSSIYLKVSLKAVTYNYVVFKGFLWTLRHSSNGIAHQGEEHSLYPRRIILLAKKIFPLNTRNMLSIKNCNIHTNNFIFSVVIPFAFCFVFAKLSVFATKYNKTKKVIQQMLY